MIGFGWQSIQPNVNNMHSTFTTEYNYPLALVKVDGTKHRQGENDQGFQGIMCAVSILSYVLWAYLAHVTWRSISLHKLERNPMSECIDMECKQYPLQQDPGPVLMQFLEDFRKCLFDSLVNMSRYLHNASQKMFQDNIVPVDYSHPLDGT